MDKTDKIEKLNKMHDDAVVLKERTQELALLINSFIHNYREQIVLGEVVSPGLRHDIYEKLSGYATELEKEQVYFWACIIESLKSIKQRHFELDDIEQENNCTVEANN